MSTFRALEEVGAQEGREGNDGDDDDDDDTGRVL